MDTESLSAKAIRYMEFCEAAPARARQAGWSRASWDALGEMVDTARFVRTGRLKEVMNWEQSVDLMHQYAGSVELHTQARRVTEIGRRVYLEMHERAKFGEDTRLFNSVALFTFDEAGKILRLDFYQQQ